MKARVKDVDHINLDGMGVGTASVMVRALKLLVEYEAGNHVTAGLCVTAQVEIEAAIEEAEAMKNGVVKELRKQRRHEVKQETKNIKTDVSDLFDEKPKQVEEADVELEALVGKPAADVPAEEIEYQESDLEDTAVNHAALADRCD